MTHGEEPEAGDCDRVERGTREGREGAVTQAITFEFELAFGLAETQQLTQAITVDVVAITFA